MRAFLGASGILLSLACQPVQEGKSRSPRPGAEAQQNPKEMQQTAPMMPAPMAAPAVASTPTPVGPAGEGPAPVPAPVPAPGPAVTPSPGGTPSISVTPAALLSAGQFLEWGVHDRQYEIQDIPWDKLDILLYGYLTICGPAAQLKTYNPDAHQRLQDDCKTKKASELTIFDRAAALSAPFDNYKKLAAKKAAEPKVKVLASIGGASLSEDLAAMAANAANRKVFVDSSIAHLEAYPFFDGFNIDWSQPKDKTQHLALVQELRAALDALSVKSKRTYLLTMTAPNRVAQVGLFSYKEFFADAAKPILNYIFLNNVDLYRTGSHERGHHSALLEGVSYTGGHSADSLLKKINAAGVPVKHILLSAASYGLGWVGVPEGKPLSTAETVEADAEKEGRPYPLLPGMYEEGVLDYKVINVRMKNNKADGWEYLWDDKVKGAYYYSKIKKATIVFDDPCALLAKIHYAKTNGLAGTLLVGLDGDNGDLVAVMATQKATGCK